METKQHVTKKPRVNEEIKMELESTLRQFTMKTQPLKIYGMLQKQFLERSSQAFLKKGLPQKRRKNSNQQLNLPPKRIRKRRTNKTKSAERRKS